MQTDKRRALTALLLLVPAPTIGVLFGMIFLVGTTGRVLFFLSKLWILLLPLAWRLAVQRQPVSLSPARRGGFGTGIALGLGISAVIFAAYALLGDRLIDAAFMRKAMAEIGLNVPAVYIGGALYWILVNSVLEEYVWRWFVFEQFERLVPALPAVALSALAFTAHHIVAMHLYFSWPVVLGAAAGIFIGGAAWSWLYLRYRSIWPGYVSHAIADLAVFAIGWRLIFGPG